AAAARTAHTGGGFASGPGEFLRLDDFHADSLEIRDREAAARPVGAGQNSTVGRYTDSRAPAGRAREGFEPEYAGQKWLRRGNQAGGGRQTTETVPELLVCEREAVRPRWLIDVDAQVCAKAGGHVGERRQSEVVDAHHHGRHRDRHPQASAAFQGRDDG